MNFSAAKKAEYKKPLFLTKRSFFELQVVILIEFGGVRDGSELPAFLALDFYEILNELLGENTACSEVIVVLFECVESLVKRGGKVAELSLFPRR